MVEYVVAIDVTRVRFPADAFLCVLFIFWKFLQNSDAGTRTRVARVKAEYPNQLDYIGRCPKENVEPLNTIRWSETPFRDGEGYFKRGPQQVNQRGV